MRMFQVDAFSDRLFAGNPAAVLILDDWLDDALMLAIARENNLAETAFARPRPQACPEAPLEWDLRWFSPAHEVEFCGHATLAAAHVLIAELGRPDPLTFRTRVGPLIVARAPEGYRLDLPRLDPQPLAALPRTLDGVFARPPLAIFQNFENIFAQLGSESALRAFRPDLSRIAGLGAGGLAITAQAEPGTGADFVSRYFAPGAGIPEDPVTGSIHATLVPWWAARLGRSRLRAVQASARGGRLDCELTPERVLIRGQAVTFLEARLRLPPRAAG